MLQLEDFVLHDQLNQQRNKDNNMPVPIIVAAAAAAAARLAAKKLAQGAAKKVLPNAIRVSAADRKRIAAKTLKARQKIDTEAIAARSVRIKSKEVKPIVLKKRPTVMKTKPNPPNPAKIEYKFGMGNNRMIEKGVPLEARIAGGVGRKSRIQTNKLKKK